MMAGRTTVELVAAAVESVDPAWLHAQAARFDESDRHIAGVAEGFRSVLREVVEAWRRYEAGGAPPAVDERSVRALRQLEELRSRQPGAALRRAADSLAQARMEARQLRASGTAGSGGAAAADERAVAVLNRVSRDFAEAGGQLLALPYGPPAPELAGRPSTLIRSTMELSAADDTTPAAIKHFGSGPSGAAALPGLPDATNPPGGQPMMPFMPMGMGGMGAMGPSAGREKQTASQGSADPSSWHEPEEGWEVVGRKGGPSTPEARLAAARDAESEATRLIDSLRDGGQDPTRTRRR